MARKTIKSEPKPLLKIEYWPISRLKAYERNPRKNDKAVGQMQASIREYGFTVPILAQSDGLVIDGHLRLKGAIAEKMPEVPVIPCDGWTAEQVKAFRLLANRSVAWANWDMDALALEFADLKASGFDLSLTGFDSKEIDGFTLVTAPEEDEIPDPPKIPTTKTGDLWIMGGHRLLCGDSTKPEDVGRLMGDERAGLIATDPPYGVKYNSAELHQNGTTFADIHNDDLQDMQLQAFLQDVFRLAASHAIRTNAAWYLWHAHLTQGFFAAAAAAAAAVILHRQIIWVKPVLVFGRGQYHWRHEPCFMGWIKGHEPANLTGHKDTTVWEIPGVPQSERADFNHPTPKPVELFRRPILKHLRQGEIAYEPFAGTGPQFIAAELTERRCFGLEMEPAFCDVIVTRWERISGNKAVLESIT